MKKLLITALFIMGMIVSWPVLAQQQKSVTSISELEEIEDRNMEYLRQIHEISKNYPEFSYKYTMEDGEIKDVTVIGVDDRVDKKRLEVVLFDLRSNRNMIKATPNRIGVFYSVDEEPEYIEGQAGLERELLSNLEYPRDALNWGVEGTIFVKFVIDENGEIPFATTASNIETSIDRYLEDLERQAVEAVKATSGNWEPGKVNGVEVASMAVVPITFEFETHPSLPTAIR
jgi:TonB family protein